MHQSINMADVSLSENQYVRFADGRGKDFVLSRFNLDSCETMLLLYDFH